MTAYWRTLGRLMSFFVIAGVSNWLLPVLSGFFHLGITGLVVAAFSLLMTTNSAKSRTTEQRVNGLVGNVGTINSTLSGLPGFTGTGTLNVTALRNFTNGTNTNFLASLTQMGPQSDFGGQDGFTGPNWGSGERGYVNDSINAGNAHHNALVNHGFMAP
ncbi:MAG TPA: hypothetical protein VGR71_05035 [Nitrospira sp.]|nr:hypothetical protein [Nitrospira sp.]